MMDTPEQKWEAPTMENYAAPVPARKIPHLGHALGFAVLAGVILFVLEATFFGVASGMHLFPHKSLAALTREPRLILPAMALSYITTLLASLLFFPLLWHRTFGEGIHWNFKVARRLALRLIAGGLLLGVTVQALSKYLPMPKSLPMDEFFRTRVDVWMVTIFGVLLAPMFEEIAFRGFILPAFAYAFDWMNRTWRPSALKQAHALRLDFAAYEQPLPEHDGSFVETQTTPREDSIANDLVAPAPPPSRAALLYSSILTSVLFALLHADQLAHAFAPLAVLFCVSMALTTVRILTDSVAASALVHASYNLSVFLALFIGTDGYRHLDKIK